MMKKLLCPSILNLPVAHLEEEIISLDQAGADIFHIDVMDGLFVNNFGMSIAELDLVRASTLKPIDVHMMIKDPIRYIELFASHGADIIYIHPEADTIPTETLSAISRLGKKAGIAVNPGTSVQTISPLFPLVDYVLVMTVNPGFCGRSYLEYVEPKAIEIAEHSIKWGFHVVIDGGVDMEIIERLTKFGIEGYILGRQALFGLETDYKESMRRLREI